MADRPAFNLSIGEFLSVGAVIVSIAVAFTFIRADVSMLKSDVNRLQLDVDSIRASQVRFNESQTEIKHTVNILLDRSTHSHTENQNTEHHK